MAVYHVHLFSRQEAMDQAGQIPCLEGISIAMLRQLDLSRGAIKLDWEDQNHTLQAVAQEEVIILEFNQTILSMEERAFLLQRGEESHLLPETIQALLFRHPETTV